MNSSGAYEFVRGAGRASVNQIAFGMPGNAYTCSKTHVPAPPEVMNIAGKIPCARKSASVLCSASPWFSTRRSPAPAQQCCARLPPAAPLPPSPSCRPFAAAVGSGRTIALSCRFRVWLACPLEPQEWCSANAAQSQTPSRWPGVLDAQNHKIGATVCSSKEAPSEESQG